MDFFDIASDVVADVLTMGLLKLKMRANPEQPNVQVTQQPAPRLNGPAPQPSTNGRQARPRPQPPQPQPPAQAGGVQGLIANLPEGAEDYEGEEPESPQPRRGPGRPQGRRE